MYNRYQGNTGKVIRVDESQAHHRVGQPPMDRRYDNNQRGGMPRQGQNEGHRETGMPRHNMPPPPPNAVPHPRKPGLLDSLGDFLPKKLEGLETDDFLIMLVLYLMYRESGDKEMLIIMGAMFLF